MSDDHPVLYVTDQFGQSRPWDGECLLCQRDALAARLAEADKLLDDAKVWVPAFAGDLMRRIYDYFARCKQMQTIRTDRENERE